jgi:hypothetical protein
MTMIDKVQICENDEVKEKNSVDKQMTAMKKE